MAVDRIADKALNLAIEAKQEVKRVEQKVDSHEELGKERYENINKTMHEIKDERVVADQKVNKHLDRIYGKQWAAMIWLIGILGVAVAGTFGYILTEADDRLENVESREVRR